MRKWNLAWSLRSKLRRSKTTSLGRWWSGLGKAETILLSGEPRKKGEKLNSLFTSIFCEIYIYSASYLKLKLESCAWTNFRDFKKLAAIVSVNLGLIFPLFGGHTIETLTQIDGGRHDVRFCHCVEVSLVLLWLICPLSWIWLLATENWTFEWSLTSCSLDGDSSMQSYSFQLETWSQDPMRVWVRPYNLWGSRH